MDTWSMSRSNRRSNVKFGSKIISICLMCEAYCRWGGVDWAESTTGYTFNPCVGYFASPGIDTR